MRSAVSAADAERSSACQDVFDYLGNEAAFVPIAHSPRFWAVGPNVPGFEVPVTADDMDLAGVKVSR
ncbi:MAG: hypothetical protein ACRDZ4_00245 [Egibacteraceae bacterium]